MGREKDAGHDLHSSRVARRTSWLPPGSLHDTFSTPRATTLMDHTEEDSALWDFLTGAPLVYTKEGHTKALPLPLGCGWGLCVGNRDLSMGSTTRLEQKCSCFSQHTSCELSPRASPRMKAVLQPASSRVMVRHGWSQPWGASAATGSWLAPAVLPVTLCLTSTMGGSPREGWCRAMATQPDFLPLAPLSFGSIAAHSPAPCTGSGAAQISQERRDISSRRRTRRAGAVAPHTRAMLPPPPLQPQQVLPLGQAPSNACAMGQHHSWAL